MVERALPKLVGQGRTPWRDRLTRLSLCGVHSGGSCLRRFHQWQLGSKVYGGEVSRDCNGINPCDLPFQKSTVFVWTKRVPTLADSLAFLPICRNQQGPTAACRVHHRRLWTLNNQVRKELSRPRVCEVGSERFPNFGRDQCLKDLADEIGCFKSRYQSRNGVDEVNARHTRRPPGKQSANVDPIDRIIVDVRNTTEVFLVYQTR